MAKNMRFEIPIKDYASQLRSLTRGLFFSVTGFFLLSIILTLILIIGSTNYHEIEILFFSVPFILISLTFVLYYFFKLLIKFRFLGIHEPTAKYTSKYSILMVIGFIIVVNSSFFAFLEVNHDLYYFQHCLALLGIVLLLIGALNFSRTLSILKDKSKIQSSLINRLLFVFPFVAISIMEIINAITRKSIFLNLDFEGYRWRTAQAEACKALNYTTFSIIAFSVIIFLYALFMISKELGTLDHSISIQHSSQLVETPSERLERICKLLSVFLIITTTTVFLSVFILLSEFYWGFWVYDEYGAIILVIEFGLLILMGMILVYANTFRFLMQIKEFSKYFPDLKKITGRIVFLIGGGIIILPLGCCATFWSMTSLISLPIYVSKIFLLIGLLQVTCGLFYLRRFYIFFKNKGYLSNRQLTGTNILFYTSMFIPLVLLAETITSSIVRNRFTETTCYYNDYCKVVLTQQGEEILQWMNISILIIFTILVIVFSMGIYLTGKNIPKIHSILDEKSIYEINTISLRNEVDIGLVKGKESASISKRHSYDYILKQRKIMNSSKNFIIFLCAGSLLSLLASVTNLIRVNLLFGLIYILDTFINSYIRIFVSAIAYVFLFIFLEELRQITRNTKAEKLSLGTSIVFYIGIILSLTFRDLSLWYIFNYGLISTFYAINILINSLLVLGCVFLMLTFNKASSRKKNHKDKLPYYGLVIASSVILVWSIILTVIISNESNINYVTIFSVGIAINIIVGVLAIIGTIKIRSEIPDLDFFQLKESREGHIEPIERDTVSQTTIYDPIDSKSDFVFCVNCGERIKSDANFCNSCGAKTISE
ncbi:MAG: zinc ribbon domain-containing protein [Candidatus Heimdallarchaeaceae archaeon]